jgi:hypothetical protein
MKIAIYADSYGCTYPKNADLNGQLPWFYPLKDYASVTNYSVGGSSLYYSYKKFLECKDKYDKNIVLGSYNNRKYVPHLLWKHVNIQITSCPELWTTHGMSQEEINAFNLYYKYIYSEIESQDIRQLIEKDIVSNSNTLYLSVPNTLDHITHKERVFFKYDERKDIENMCCHMSNESNQVLSSTILEWVNTGSFKFNLDDYKLPNKEDRYKYYI